MTDTSGGAPSSRRAARGAARPGAHGKDPGIHDLFAGDADTHAVGSVPPRPTRRRRRARAWTALVIVVVILGGLIGGGAWAWNTFGERARDALGWSEPKDWEAGLAHDDALVTIEKGDVGRDVSTRLFDAGVTKTADALYDLLVRTSPNHPFQPGSYRLQQQMSASAALAALDDPANRVENTVLLREGLTVPQSIARISEEIGIPLSDLQAAIADPSVYGVSADSLEGWLFPATYTFPPGTTAKDVVARLVARTEQSLDAAGVPVADRQRILTIASIIQREARESTDFFKVSRVIQNRLAIGMKLQMDSTAQFGFGELHDGTVSTSAQAQNNDNPYNTYVITGLPAGPIANPGDTAIDAAMHPVDGPWLYFVTVNLDTGETVFSTNFADHEAASARWRAWCVANPTSGC